MSSNLIIYLIWANNAFIKEWGYYCINGHLLMYRYRFIGFLFEFKNGLNKVISSYLLILLTVIRWNLRVTRIYYLILFIRLDVYTIHWSMYISIKIEKAFNCTINSHLNVMNSTEKSVRMFHNITYSCETNFFNIRSK